MASKPKTHTLVYQVTTETQHGYPQTRVRVWLSGNARLKSIAECIAGCVDNAAGYGDPDAARRMLARYTELRSRGVTHVFDSGWGDSTVAFRWQHYTPRDAKPEDPQQYCECDVEIEGYARKVNGSVELYQRLRKMMHRAFPKTWDTLDTPATLIATLDKAGAQRVTLIRHIAGETYASEYCVGGDAGTERAAAE